MRTKNLIDSCVERNGKQVQSSISRLRTVVKLTQDIRRDFFYVKLNFLDRSWVFFVLEKIKTICVLSDHF